MSVLILCSVLGVKLDLVGVQDFEEGLVDVGLALEAVLYLVDVVDGVVELHGLVVLHWRGRGRAADGGVGLQRGRPRRGVWGDRGAGMTARSKNRRLQRLEGRRWKNQRS